jgi:two-component system cell cycle response regulator
MTGLETRATILLVDDQAAARDRTARLLRDGGYRVTLAADGQEALDRFRSELPDLLVLDVLMPRLSGLEVTRILKGTREGGFVPILLLSSRSDTESRVGALRAGADDFLAKPYDSGELVARIEALLRIKKQFDELVRSKRELEDAVVVDPQTGLYNLRFLHRRLPEEFARAQRYDDTLAFLVLALDGGRVADRQAQKIGEALARIVRTVDLLARSGDAEFAILLPSTHLAGALPVARRAQNALRQMGVSGSIGAAFFPSKQVTSADDLLRQATVALARAREEGPGWMCLLQHQSYLYRPEPE